MSLRRSDSARRASTGPIGERVRDEQVEMLFVRNRVPLLVGLPFALILCAVAWNAWGGGALLAWLGLKVASAVIRLGLDVWRQRRPESATSARWASRYTLALGLDGLVWSFLVLFFAGLSQGELAPVAIATTIGLGASGAVALSMDRRANAVFAAALLVPGALRLLAFGGRLGLFGGIAMLLFLGMVIEHGVRVSQETEELLRLRFEVAGGRDAALAAARLKSDFLATMSHELRTPLNAVIGMAALLADTEMTADQRERLDVIRTSGETLLTLIGDILDVSKIEAGKLQVESAPVEIARVLEESLDQVAAAALAKGLEIGYRLSDDCPAAIVSDPTRVRQILVNLLGNAVKFTDRGSVTVHVQAATRELERVELTFTVHDTGIGIEPARLNELFVPFTQADSTTTRRYGGTGLGLAICKSLSELLGGTIGAESVPGEGATFHFSIVGKPLPQARARAFPINAGSRVCVVSDDATARELLAHHVSGFGFATHVVASLAAGLEVVAADEADIVLLDLRGQDEELAVTSLRAARAGMPLVLLVAPRPGSPNRVIPADPFVATVSKPVKTARLLEVIEALLAGRSAPPRMSSSADLEPIRAGDSAGASALVVDDNEINRRVALEMVRRLGLTVQAVASGAQAIEAVRRERFEYVLMDIQMPDMDGFEATRRILEVAVAPKPRVIAMTANALPGDRERCLKAGMSDYVTKPVRPQTLAAALKRHYAPPEADASERSGITDVLDTQVLEDLRMLEETSGASLIAELAASFSADVPLRMAELRKAAEARDLDLVRSLAHRLRGSAGAVGANRVFVTMTEVETGAAKMGATELLSLIAYGSKEATRAIDAFRRVVERMKREGESGGAKKAARDEGAGTDAPE
jgi:signal transduction histidine kinase/DNA-binding response OmpR family regulator